MARAKRDHGVRDYGVNVPSEPKRDYVIRKDGYFYRPNAAGYTKSLGAAGRYTKEEAEQRVDPGAGVTMHLASEFPLDLYAALKRAIDIADEAREEWDKAPSGMRAGKILIALSGGLPGYRRDIDEIHAALKAALNEAGVET